VPLFIGGHSKAAARRAGRLGDGFQPLGLAGDDLAAAVATMRDAAGDAKRDPSEVELVLGATLGRVDAERVGKAAAQGAGRLLLSVSRGASTLDDVLGQLDAAAGRIGLGR
jgi:alkanesulfonate monooxygenase SsuD/methylene tetrahydromethanopterin reductase-like flavin-dependent oxidoreductase (luciferase family)